MYVTTFYSFKGGVGRTMALVNAAVELANRGRRVVVVDFDLEAPGLDSFRILRPEKKTPGIVDFVRQYLDTARAPAVKDFVYQASGVGKEGGELWVMPAGADRREYGVKFRDIDWQDLYARRDGYLLFEDLKEQWKEILQADWVFVDSRTGHTDTGGICTRQLPDAVVAVFFPNAQNRRGLAAVVRQIRAEARTARKKEITLHFLMSNVPDLDDEDRILQRQIHSFRRDLAMEPRAPLVVNRYDALALLTQAVFVTERPRSRLAAQYRDVVDEIVKANLADRDGALLYVAELWDLDRLPRWRRRGLSGPRDDYVAKLEEIEEHHSGDPDVLYALGRLYDRQRRNDDASRLFDAAIEHGCVEPEALLSRSARRSGTGDQAGATRDAVRVLQVERVRPWHAISALRLAADAGPDDLVATPAVQAMPGNRRVSLGVSLEDMGETGLSRAVLESVEDSELSERTLRRRNSSLSRICLADGRCGEAMSLLEHGGRSVADMDMADAFNYGMATWCSSGAARRSAFARVVRQARSRGEREKGANFRQCLAVAQWVIGDAESAREALCASREAATKTRIREMSCWRYTRVSREEFLSDCDEIEALIEGDLSRRPHFMAARNGHPASGKRILRHG